MIRLWWHRTSKEKYYFFRYDENQTKMSNIFQCIKYRVSSVKVRLRRSFHFVSFYCYLGILLRANVSVAVVEYIELLSVLFALFVCLHICLLLKALVMLCLWIPHFVYDHKDIRAPNICSFIYIHISLVYVAYTRAECVNVCLLLFGVHWSDVCPVCSCSNVRHSMCFSRYTKLHSSWYRLRSKKERTNAKYIIQFKCGKCSSSIHDEHFWLLFVFIWWIRRICAYNVIRCETVNVLRCISNELLDVCCCIHINKRNGRHYALCMLCIWI